MYKKTKAILKEFKMIVNPQNRTIGSVLKHFRKEQDLTLEDVSDSICSVSYLCKVERDQLVPSNDKLNLLMRRLGIDPTDINPEEKNTDYIDDISSNNFVSDEIYNKYSKRHDYQAKIINFAKALLNEKDVHKSRKLKYEVIDYFFNFSKLEMEFVLYLIIRDAYISEDYHSAVLLFKELERFCENKKILINAALVCIESLYKLERLNDVNIILSEYLPIYYKYNRYDEISILKNIELKMLARIGYKEDLVHELTLINIDEKINVDFLWFNYYFFNQKNYQEALNYINKIKDINQSFYLHYLIVLEKLEKKELLIKNLNNPIFDFDKVSYQIVYKLLKSIYVDGEDINENSEYLHIDSLTGNHYILNYIYEILVRESRDNYCYKRCSVILEKQKELLKEKASIIYNK